MPPDYACPVCKQAYTMVHIPRKKTVFPIIGDPYTVIGPEFDISYRCGCNIPADQNKSELEQLKDEVKELRKLLEDKLNPPKVTITLNGTTLDPQKKSEGTGDFNPLGTWYSTCKTIQSVL